VAGCPMCVSTGLVVLGSNNMVTEKEILEAAELLKNDKLQDDDEHRRLLNVALRLLIQEAARLKLAIRRFKQVGELSKAEQEQWEKAVETAQLDKRGW
jgi:hypothetical protein